jgi:hypothetical protein
MTTKPESSGLTRTQKEFTDLLMASQVIAQKLGRVTHALGTHTAHIAIMPKQAASDLLVTAEQLEEVRGEVLDLANEIIDWEQGAIKAVGAREGLVKPDGQPLTR